MLVASASNFVVGQTFQFGGDPQVRTIVGINPGPFGGFVLTFTPGLNIPGTNIGISPFTCTMTSRSLILPVSNAGESLSMPSTRTPIGSVTIASLRSASVGVLTITPR